LYLAVLCPQQRNRNAAADDQANRKKAKCFSMRATKREAKCASVRKPSPQKYS